MEAGSDYVTANMRIALLPLITYFFCLPVFTLWAMCVTYVYSIGTPIYKKDSFIAEIKWDIGTREMLWILLFALFWVIALLIAIMRFIIGCTVCMWYYSNQDADGNSSNDRTSIAMSLKWALCYHIGSLAYGAFCIAVVNFIKAMFEYIAKKNEAVAGKDNPIFKCITCYIRYFIWCLDTYIKYITDNSYVQIALHNMNFCEACWKSFYLLVRHCGRFSSTTLVARIMTLIGKGAICVTSAYITMVIVDKQYPRVV